MRTLVAKGKLGGVVERLSSGICKGLSLLGDLGVIQELFGFEDCLFGVPEYSIHAADGEHGEDDVKIFAPL
jgi:hypothetical protein